MSNRPYETRSGKNAILICARMLSCVVLVGFLVACGSGDGGGVGGGGVVKITCMDVSTNSTADCNGTSVAPKPGVRSAQTSATWLEWRADDDCTLDQTALANIVVGNSGTGIYNGVFVAPLFINGTGDMGFIMGNRQIAGLTRHTEQFGGSWSANTLEGPNVYEITFYNGPVDMDTFAPTWNNMWTDNITYSWDWDEVDADMATVGLIPITRGRVHYNYIP